jgi:carbon storage regulator
MLVLSRKVGESIVIAGGITLKVVEIRGNKIKLGIEAPKEISVYRQEVYDRVVKEVSTGSEDGPNPATEQD